MKQNLLVFMLHILTVITYVTLLYVDYNSQKLDLGYGVVSISLISIIFISIILVLFTCYIPVQTELRPLPKYQAKIDMSKPLPAGLAGFTQLNNSNPDDVETSETGNTLTFTKETTGEITDVVQITDETTPETIKAVSYDNWKQHRGVCFTKSGNVKSETVYLLDTLNRAKLLTRYLVRQNKHGLWSIYEDRKNIMSGLNRKETVAEYILSF